MSRTIDKLSRPTKPKKMRVVVASCSRTGTFGLYLAMKSLGFAPYHLAEVLHKHGIQHMRIFREAVLAQHYNYPGNRPYNKADFAKWLGDYDCLVEIPSYLGTGALAMYAEDPDTKFILIERDPSKWLKSMNNTTARAIQMGNMFPLNVLKFFDEEMYSFLELNKVLYGVWSDGTSPGSPENERALRENYIQYTAMAKRVIPKERLLALKLEEGLGWEQICPFLGLPVPDTEYPRVRNEPETFQRAISGYLWRRARVAAFRLGALALPISVIAGYLWWALF